MREISACGARTATPQKSFRTHFRTHLSFEPIAPAPAIAHLYKFYIHVFLKIWFYHFFSCIFKKIHSFAIYSSIKTLLEPAGFAGKDALKQKNEVLKQERTFLNRKWHSKTGNIVIYLKNRVQKFDRTSHAQKQATCTHMARTFPNPFPHVQRCDITHMCAATQHLLIRETIRNMWGHAAEQCAYKKCFEKT